MYTVKNYSPTPKTTGLPVGEGIKTASSERKSQVSYAEASLALAMFAIRMIQF